MATTFPGRLREAMDAKGIKAAAMAARTGLSRAAISQYLSGQHTPTESRMELLAEMLDVSVDWLSGKDQPPPETTGDWPDHISVQQAARCMGKGAQFVREGLKRKILPIGSAVPGSGSGWVYYISPDKLREFVGPITFDRFFGISKEVG